MVTFNDKKSGIRAVYDNPADLLCAVRDTAAAGLTKLETFSPVLVEGIDQVLPSKETRMPWITLLAAATGGILALAGLWWVSVVDYPWNVSGKPLWSIPSDLIIAFEVTILFGALATFGSFVWLMIRTPRSLSLDMPMPQDVSNDRFYLFISAQDPLFNEVRIRDILSSTGPMALESVSLIKPTQRPRSALAWFWVTCLAIIIAGWITGVLLPRAFRGQTQMYLLSDMVSQSRFECQEENPFFDDGRASREAPSGTVAVGEMRSFALDYGLVNGIWIDYFPQQVPLDEVTYHRGKREYGIYCAPCHGVNGNGSGLVDQRWKSVSQKWIATRSLIDSEIAKQPVGQLYHDISFGAKGMPSHGSALSNSDRWAIAMYVRVLQYLDNRKWTNVHKTVKDLLSITVLTLLALLVSFIFDHKKTFQGIKIAFQKLCQVSTIILEMIVLISIVLVLIPDSTIAAYLGVGQGFAGVLIAAILGSIVFIPGFVVFPLCGILLKKGVAYMVLSGFSSTSMMVGVLTFPLERKYFGTKVTILRNLIALLIALVVAVATGIFYGEYL